MAITFDSVKREATLAERGLDFADAEQVFVGPKFQWVDDRFDYGEVRVTTVGLLGDRMVFVVWTQRGVDRHVISMRKANVKEQRRFKIRLD
jgi:uncharacterized protein